MVDKALGRCDVGAHAKWVQRQRLVAAFLGVNDASRRHASSIERRTRSKLHIRRCTNCHRDEVGKEPCGSDTTSQKMPLSVPTKTQHAAIEVRKQLQHKSTTRAYSGLAKNIWQFPPLLFVVQEVDAKLTNRACVPFLMPKIAVSRMNGYSNATYSIWTAKTITTQKTIGLTHLGASVRWCSRWAPPGRRRGACQNRRLEPRMVP